MRHDGVIFLIDSKSFDKDLMRLSIEKLTNCKVFNFFSLDEAALYLKLKPKAIIYSSDNHEGIDSFPVQVDFIDISERINQEGKEVLVKHATLADKLSDLLRKNLN